MLHLGTRITNYTTVIQPEVLYEAETLDCFTDWKRNEYNFKKNIGIEVKK